VGVRVEGEDETLEHELELFQVQLLFNLNLDFNLNWIRVKRYGNFVDEVPAAWPPPPVIGT
jgi:hypothetical protein